MNKFEKIILLVFLMSSLIIGTRQYQSNAAPLPKVVKSITNTDGTLTISPTTGDVIALLNLANTNTWTGNQIFNSFTATVGNIANSLITNATISGNLIGNSATFSGSVTLNATSTMNGSPICTAGNGVCKGGLTSLNGLTALTQTFVNDSNVIITSSGSTHALGWNGALPIERGGTNATTTTIARTNLGAAAFGANTDITSIVLTATSTINGSPICTAANGLCAGTTQVNQFGNGSDGNVTISANTNLTRDMYYNNLTINSGVTLFTKNFRIYVANILTNNGVIDNNGNSGGNGTSAGAPSAGGGGAGAIATISDGTLPVGLSGVSGGAGGDGGTFSPTAGLPGSPGVIGINQKLSLGSLGNNGNDGGNGGTCFNAGGTGGIGGSGGLASSVIDPLKNVATAYQLFDFLPMLNLNNSAGSGGSGGGGGGRGGQGLGGGGGGGGGSGSGGGTILIFAKNIVNNGTIRAEGGIGGNGGNGGNAQINAGGGGGGGAGIGGSGGVIILTYKSKTGIGSASVSGGAAGTPGLFGLQAGGCGTQGSTGGSSQSGALGKIYELQL